MTYVCDCIRSIPYPRGTQAPADTNIKEVFPSIQGGDTPIDAVVRAATRVKKS